MTGSMYCKFTKKFDVAGKKLIAMQFALFLLLATIYMQRRANSQVVNLDLWGLYFYSLYLYFSVCGQRIIAR
jgi:hypothetical protein